MKRTQADGAGQHVASTPGASPAAVRKTRPTMADVAQLAGTSTQTVSRVLRGHPYVSDHARREVLAAIEKTGYRRTTIARSFTTGRTMSIGLVTFDSNPYYARSAIVLGAQRAAQSRGYSVAVAGTTSLSAAAVGQAVDHLREQAVDGLVIAIPVGDDPSLTAATDGIPTVVVDGPETMSSEVVAVDQVGVGRKATQYLLGLGHSTVWHVGGPPSWTDATLRSQGWAAALRDAGRQVPPLLIGDWSPQSGYRNGEVIGRLPEVTAVFVASDEMAFGVIRALKEMGRRVPGDVSVVSVDDIALARYCDPPLTTVRQPFEQVGQQAASQVIELIDHPEARRGRLVVEAELIVRESASSPAGSPS